MLQYLLVQSLNNEATAEFTIWASEDYVSLVYFVDKRLLGVHLAEGISSSERVTDGEVGK